MEDTNLSKMSQILSLLRDRYKLVESLMSTTKEMEKAVALNDMDSLGMILSMREDAMARVDQARQEIADIAETLEGQYLEKIRRMLYQGDEEVPLENPMDEEIFNVNKQTKNAMKKLIELDVSVNERFQQASRPSVSGRDKLEAGGSAGARPGGLEIKA